MSFDSLKHIIIYNEQIRQNGNIYWSRPQASDNRKTINHVIKVENIIR